MLEEQLAGQTVAVDPGGAAGVPPRGSRPHTMPRSPGQSPAGCTAGPWPL